ncbi:DUF4365 domain-containing protein [candidate division KSB1 bacterium]|nr:DUF4365 domain-containing protein [candidate division KSB1 bacterium]
MTKISNNLVKANFGVNLVSFVLSKHCLVRHVTEGTDIGIDLYFESFAPNGEPFLHFWIQVKTGDSCINVSKDEKTASFQFDSEHLDYWSKQPIPVFAFLVPYQLNQDSDNFKFFVVDITDQTLREKVTTQQFKTLTSDFIVSEEDELEEFVFNRVPYTTAVQKISYGIISTIPTVRPEYQLSLPAGLSPKYSKKIIKSIRRTVTFALQDILALPKESEQILHDKDVLLKILHIFEDDKKWEIPYTLGRKYYMDLNFQKAQSYFAKAIEIIESDPNTLNVPVWEQRKNLISEFIIACKQRRGLL